MLAYDPKTDLRHYPGIPMSRYGQNQYGENLFRIVFASSRRTLVCGVHSDGGDYASWAKEYGHLGDKWVMEKWVSPFAFSQMTREQWDREMLINGPYPDRGEYVLCHVFDTCVPAEANLDKLVSWINEGRNHSFSSVREACANKYANEEKATGDRIEAEVRDTLPAFGVSPLAGYGGGRGTKTGILRYSASELGLPLTGGLRSR